MTPVVTLLAYTPEPVHVMALAARLCYVQGITIADLAIKLTNSECEKLLKKIISNKHLGILEHATFTFGIEGVSRNFSHQMVRHRNTSYDQQSLHYTVAPETIQVLEPPGLTKAQQHRFKIVKNMAYIFYKQLISEGIPKEEARHILPSGIETKLIMTANLRQWMHFIAIRACIVNCHEITVVAHKIKKYLETLMPFLAEYLGPTCHTESICYEGNRFCGSPWRVPCAIKGDGNNGHKVYDLVEAKEWKPTK